MSIFEFADDRGAAQQGCGKQILTKDQVQQTALSSRDLSCLQKITKLKFWDIPQVEIFGSNAEKTAGRKDFEANSHLRVFFSQGDDDFFLHLVELKWKTPQGKPRIFLKIFTYTMLRLVALKIVQQCKYCPPVTAGVVPTKFESCFVAQFVRFLHCGRLHVVLSLCGVHKSAVLFVLPNTASVATCNHSSYWTESFLQAWTRPWIQVATSYDLLLLPAINMPHSFFCRL